MSYPMELRGRTLHLRLPRPDDAEALFALASDPDVTRWFSWGPYVSAAEPAAWIEAQESRRERGDQLDFVIVADGGRIAGVTGLSELVHRDRRATVGTWLGKEFWGTGANAESKSLLVRLAFKTCGLDRLTAYSNPTNERSARALEKVGFTREGTLRSWHRHENRRLDVHIFSLLREEWAVSPAQDEPCTVIGQPPDSWLLA